MCCKEGSVSRLNLRSKPNEVSLTKRSGSWTTSSPLTSRVTMARVALGLVFSSLSMYFATISGKLFSVVQMKADTLGFRNFV